jgi:hypothetical protein
MDLAHAPPKNAQSMGEDILETVGVYKYIIDTRPFFFQYMQKAGSRFAIKIPRQFQVEILAVTLHNDSEI